MSDYGEKPKIAVNYELRRRKPSKVSKNEYKSFIDSELSKQINDRKMETKRKLQQLRRDVEKYSNDIIVDVPKGKHARIKFSVNGNPKVVIHVLKGKINPESAKLQIIREITSKNI